MSDPYPPAPIRIQYDESTRTVYISRQPGAKLCDSVVVSLKPKVTVDYDADGQVYGIQVSDL